MLKNALNEKKIGKHLHDIQNLRTFALFLKSN